MTYCVYQRGHLVGSFDSYAQANGRVLNLSGKSRLWDAVEFHMTSTKIQLQKVLVTSSIAVSDIGPRATAHTSWRSLYKTISDAVWWMPPNANLYISLLASFGARDYMIPSSLSFSRNEGERPALSYSQFYGAFDHVAETHEITDFATDWPQ